MRITYIYTILTGMEKGKDFRNDQDIKIVEKIKKMEEEHVNYVYIYYIDRDGKGKDFRNDGDIKMVKNDWLWLTLTGKSGSTLISPKHSL